MNELLSRRVISVTKLKDGVVLALCEDGTMWVSHITRTGKATWMPVNPIPQNES